MDCPKLKIQKYPPLIISGCSGVGKGTVITNLISTFPQLFELSISYTTRKARPEQIHGKHYYFITKEQFEKEIKKGIFAEHCQVHGNYYGTSENQLQSIIQKGKICLLDIDIQGGEKIYNKHPNWNFIFITPPSIEELQLRLKNRGTETAQAIKKRLHNAKIELKKLQELKFYQNIMNDNIKQCYGDIIHYINKKYHLLIQIEAK